MQIQKVIEQYKNNPFAIRWALNNYFKAQGIALTVK